MEVSRADSATRRQTRLPNGPERCATSQQTTAAVNGATASIQSPQTDALSLPYRVSRTPACTLIRTAAIVHADARSLDIQYTFRASAAPLSDWPTSFGPEYERTPVPQNQVLPLCHRMNS